MVRESYYKLSPLCLIDFLSSLLQGMSVKNKLVKKYKELFSFDKTSQRKFQLFKFNKFIGWNKEDHVSHVRRVLLLGV